MIVTLLVAMDERGGIGINNRLPWHLPADLSRFRRLTMGHYLIMGRKTYESLGRPLPGRTMIVVTRQPDFVCTDCVPVHSIEAGLAYALDKHQDLVFIIGGAEIFSQALPLADKLHITLVHTVVEADKFFPHIDLADWQEIGREMHLADDRHAYPYSFIDYQKIVSSK